MAWNNGWNLKDWLKMAQEEKFNVNSLARRLGKSPRQFGRLTLEWFGHTPKTLIDRERILLAPVLLVNVGSVKPAAAVLHLTQRYFSRRFKEHYGVLPTEFLSWAGQQEKLNGKPLTPEEIIAGALAMRQMSQKATTMSQKATSPSFSPNKDQS